MKLPKEIDGVEVEPVGKEIEMHGEVWRTMLPVDDDDRSIWEFSLTTGRIVKTQGIDG